MLGKISIQDDAKILNTVVIPLVPSVQNASKMRFGETLAQVNSANWSAYSTSANYNLVDQDDGVKTIYAQYSDDAGNTTGSNGEISVSFILDSSAPDLNQITLLAPASPTGAFNTPLAWLATFEEDVSYEVEVYDEDDYSGTPVRSMETTETIVNVSPALENLDRYYWRVRVLDAAGNASDWVNSGLSKSFDLRVLAESYQAKKEVYGIAGKESLLGRDMVMVGDLNADGVSEFAVSIMRSEYQGCAQCGLVKIIDGADGSILATLKEGLRDFEQYGRKLVTCDLNNDGKDELIVAAPGKKVIKNDNGNQWEYSSAGGLYVYNLDAFNLMASYDVDLGMTHPAPGYNGCWFDPQSNRNRCGWDDPMSFPIDDPMIGGGNGRSFGANMVCARRAGAADHILVGDTRYGDNSGGWTNEQGRVMELELSGMTLGTIETIANPSTMSWTRFGQSVAYLSKFRYSDSGTCTDDAATIAVGAPELSGTNWDDPRGRVYLFQMSAGDWAECASITLSAEANWQYERWGSYLHNIGNIDEDASDIEELAIAGSASNNGGGMWGGGVVRIYGGTSGTQLKSLRLASEAYRSLGYHITNAGDFDEDDLSYNPHIAITAPAARINGQPDAGRVLIYRWDDIDNDDDDGNGSADADPTLDLIGSPKPSSFLGARFFAMVPNNDFTVKPSSMLVASPGRTSQAAGGCPPPGPCGGGMAPGGMNAAQGAYQQFAYLKLAPDLPYKIAGTSTNAQMGTSLLGLPDIDNDSAPDFLIGQAGGRCQGRPFGAISLFSSLDGEITRSLCADEPNDKIGTTMIPMPEAQLVIFPSLGSSGTPPNGTRGLYFSRYGDFLQRNSIRDLRATGVEQYWNGNLSDTTPSISNVVNATAMAYFSAAVRDTAPPNNQDIRLWQLAIPLGNGPYSPSITITPNDLGMPFNNGKGDEKCLGNSLAMFKKEVTVPLSTHVLLAAGVPCMKNADDSLGMVTLFNRQQVNQKMTVSAEGLLGVGNSAANGFGNFVFFLGDLGVYDQGGANEFAADFYILVSNVNILHGSSADVPELFIIGVKLGFMTPPDDDKADWSNFSAATFKVIKYEPGAAGSMLGAYAKLLPDINGDGVNDFAISHPGGIGQMGSATGQVRIYSGAGITTEDESDDLLQVLYNPEAEANNFGSSIEYADITGDGIADFVVGASKYDNGIYKDAGAVYIFKMSPVQ